jgi:hypothetical protein
MRGGAAGAAAVDAGGDVTQALHPTNASPTQDLTRLA